MTVRLAGCVVTVGGTFTVKIAALLVTLPTLLLIVTVNWALLSEAVVAGVVYDAEVAPLTAVPFFFHWYVRVAVPVAVAEKVVVWPAMTVLLAGSVVTLGRICTVNVATLLVTLTVLPVTVTVEEAPLSDATVAPVV